MPIIKSAKKALRQNIRRRALNLKRGDSLKKIIKNYKKLVKEKKLAEAKKIFSEVQKVLDKLAKVGFIKKNKARRLKSRLSKQLK